MAIRNLGAQLRSQYEFRSEIIETIIKGVSMLDSNLSMHMRSPEDAVSFMKSYGYDIHNPIERAEVHGNFQEALNFLRRHFLQPDKADGVKLEIPRRILEITDISDLLLMASLHYPGQTSDTQGVLLKQWACAILKVMHTIAHIDKDLRAPYFVDIQMQILDRFYKVIHRDPDGQLYLGDKDGHPIRINLVAFETKPKKSRDSIILKLLHKPENVAEDIFDRVGIRFVTETPLEGLRVIKYLRDNMIIIAANIKPSRSRNTLVDIDRFRERLRILLEQADKNEINEAEFLAELERAARPPEDLPDNPHSSKRYRAIQFTCRQLIKLQNPLYDTLKDLKAQARSNPAVGDVLKTMEKLDLSHLQREVRFFYPYEIQIMDREAAEENERGHSAHSTYKSAQVQTALRRVLGGLLDVPR